MLTLTRKADYALVALAFLGRCHRDGTPPVSARQIAEKFNLPSPLLSNVLKDLAHARLVSSTRGPAGGYELAADPARTTLMEVIAAVDGPVQLSMCCNAADGLRIIGQGCELAERCPIRTPIRRLHQRIVGVLERTTLADLMDDEEPADRGAYHTVSTTR